MAQDQQYGGFWARLVALVLDSAIVFFIQLAALLSMGTLVATVGMESMMDVAAWLVLTFVPFLYWPVLESSGWQATFGKRIMGLEVTDADGNRLSFLHALLRSLAKIISGIPLGLGFLLAAFTARKQALHDIIVKTLVVRTGPSHLWKVILALIVGFVLMVASAAGLFYYVVVPMFKKGFGDSMQEAMKDAPQMKTIPSPAPAPAAKAPQSKPEAPKPQTSGAATAAGKEGPDPDFDAIFGKPLIGMEKPGTTRAGPAILELSTMFPTTLWVKVYVPVPSLGDPALLPEPSITVNRVLDSGGKDYYDADSTFEKGDFFRRPSLSAKNEPVPHLGGTRNVNLKPGLSEQALQKVEGQVNFTVPVDPRSVTFEAKDIGKEQPLHDSSVSLRLVSGNSAKLHFRGASENLLLVRGYGADGKMLAVESRQTLPQKQDVDDDFTITFKGPVTKVEFEVAAKVIERFFPFSLARGAVAGPPSAAAGGITLPPRPRAAKVAAAAPTPAASSAPAAPVSAPAPAIAAPVKPEAAPAKPEPKPKAAPKAQAAQSAPAPAAAKAEAAPRPARKPRAAPEPMAPPPEPLAKPGPKFNDVMTAVLYRDPAGVNELLDRGRWIDKPDSFGFTPLMVAVRLRDAQMAQLLLGRGADPNARAAGGVSPLSIARANGDAAMAELLQKSGAR